MSDEKPGTSRKEDEKGAKEKEKATATATAKKKDTTEEKQDDTAIDAIQTSFRDLFKKLSLTFSSDSEEGPVERVIEDLSVDGLVKHWKEKGFKNIITMVGAGISTSAGIPDFRSPGSGLYDNLQKYNLPHPSAIFEMNYFQENPQPFFALAKELYPGSFNPTPSHYFVRLLHDKGLLLRHYTQNIDTLERIAGIPDEKLVEAHGTFYTNHCLECHKKFSMEWMKKQIFSDHVPTCTRCNGIVKPDIVFFGENLPEKFHELPSADFKKCDLLIVMGTSLEVQPFASLVDRAGPKCIRLLINRTKVGNSFGALSSWFMSGPGFMFDHERNTRDVALIGDCDDGVMKLVEGLGWSTELKDLIKKEHERLAKKDEGSSKESVQSPKESKKKQNTKQTSDEQKKKDDEARLLK